jgi:hypothetical protein
MPAILMLFLLPSDLHAQVVHNERRLHRELSVGAGAGTGSFVLAIRLAFNGAPFSGLYDDDLIKLYSTPVITADYQQPVGRAISVGFAGSFQMFRTAYTRGDFGDVYTRTNLSIRPVFHLPAGNRFNSYAGFRIGMTIWKFSTDNPDPGYYEAGRLRPRPAFQLFYGLRYFFLSNLGAGFELGLGTAPYLVQANLAVRL